MNNAGRSQRAMAVHTDLEVDKQMIQLNTVGQISLTKVVLPHMLKRKKGHIVVTSSIAGKFGLCITLLLGIVRYSDNYEAS